jgi:uncharacterized damage-inducible protein DinB
MSTDPFARELIDSWLRIFESQKKLADGAITQLSDAQLHQRPAPNLNSAAIIMRHLAGNMRSRWTAWLTSDGEKADRDRDREFLDFVQPRDELLMQWENAWSLVFTSIRTLTTDDLARTITIRGEKHSIPDAVNRQISHYGYHTGQLHLIARGIVGNDRWRWQTVPPGGTRAFNASMSQRFGPWSGEASAS